MKSLLFSLALFLLGCAMKPVTPAEKNLPDFDPLWNYDQPAETEARFRALLPEAEKSGSREYHLQLLTQLARTQSLQGKFPEAHQMLDQVEDQLDSATPVAEVRYLLERGRTYNSSRQRPTSLPLFQKALQLAQERRIDFHAVDAAHMLAIAEADPKAQMDWNLKALKMAEQSADPKARNWLGSLYNNIGWTYHDSQKYSEALEMFQKALAFRERKGKPSDVRVAKWSVARALRSLGRFEDALRMQRALEIELKAASQKDGYVYEELAELLAQAGKAQEARKYFGLAYEELSNDIWIKRNEPKRLERLRAKGGK